MFYLLVYRYEDNTEYIQLKNKLCIKLSQASIGLQSVLPLLLVLWHNTPRSKREGTREDLFVVEEPALNLSPAAQKDLMEFIISRINQSGSDKIILTTHSPYVLTVIDNLIQANTVTDLHPDKKKEIKHLVNEDAWIEFERVSCYYFDQGTCKSTLDMENKSIGPSSIDDVSIKLSETYEKLLSVKYAQA